MTLSKVRAIITNDDGDILVGKYTDSEEGMFYMLLGGTFELSDANAWDALLRELREEIEVEVDEMEYLDVLNNTFTWHNKSCHEMVVLFRVTLKVLPTLDSALNDDGTRSPLEWIPAEDIREEKVVIYPICAQKYI